MKHNSMTLQTKLINSSNNKTKKNPLTIQKQISIILRRIFQNIESMDKSQLKALYLTVIDRIEIRKDGNHKNSSTLH